MSLRELGSRAFEKTSAGSIEPLRAGDLGKMAIDELVNKLKKEAEARD